MSTTTIRNLAIGAALSVVGSVTALAGQGALAETHDRAHPAVTVEQGELAGKRVGDVDAFLGVPFAAAPVGENRWRAPQAFQAWEGIRPAQEYGANCIQLSDQLGFGAWTHEYLVADNFSEDCLFLNVWRPADVAADAKLPVMFWIHGGGMTTGSGAVPIYEGRNLATKGMIVVTINYRVGPLGFLALPELTAEAGDAPPSNYGFQDQVAALDWVYRNIASFGGDPEKITIAGQSAGSFSVHALLASPMTAGKFSQAIAQSGLPSVSRTPSLSEGEKTGLAFMQSLGARNLAELRAMRATAFAPTKENPRFAVRTGPVVDGKLLPDDPQTMMMSGRANDVPMIVGQVANENVGVGAVGPSLTQEELAEAVATAFPADPALISSLYHPQNGAQRAETLREMRKDKGLAAHYMWAAQRAEANESPTWVYLFDHVEPGPESDKWRVFHSSELPYLFGTLDKAPERGFTFADWQVSMTMADLWASFVKTGVPQARDAQDWPQFDAEAPMMMVLKENGTAQELLTDEKRDAFDRYVAQGGTISMF